MMEVNRTLLASYDVSTWNNAVSFAMNHLNSPGFTILPSR